MKIKQLANNARMHNNTLAGHEIINSITCNKILVLFIILFILWGGSILFLEEPAKDIQSLSIINGTGFSLGAL